MLVHLSIDCIPKPNWGFSPMQGIGHMPAPPHPRLACTCNRREREPHCRPATERSWLQLTHLTVCRQPAPRRLVRRTDAPALAATLSPSQAGNHRLILSACRAGTVPCPGFRRVLVREHRHAGGAHGAPMTQHTALSRKKPKRHESNTRDTT